MANFLKWSEGAIPGKKRKNPPASQSLSRYKMKRQLKGSFKILNESVVLPKRIGGTLWLPHMSRVIHLFLQGYTAFKLHLETSSHKNAKAEGLAKLLRDCSVVFMLDLKI